MKTIKTKLSIYAIALGLCIIGITNSAKAQTTIYSEGFTSLTPPAIPTGWVDVLSDGGWGTDDGTSVPSCTVSGSSGGNMLVGTNGGSLATEDINFVSFSTTGRTGLTVTWNELRANSNGGAPTLKLYYSTTGSTFTNVPFTDVTANDTWQATSTISLPVACENQPTVYLRYEYIDNGNGDYILIDDILVQAASASYYLQAGGTITSVLSWGVNPDGSGAHPSDFTSNSQKFYIQNNASVTLSAPTWSVSGTSVIVYVGDGTTATNFIVSSASTFAVSGGAIINVQNNGTLTLQSSTNPLSGSSVLATGSTIDYNSSGSATMATLTTYYNLNISAGTKTFAGSNTVNGALTISSGAIAVLPNSAIATVTLKGNISCAGTITGQTNSKLTIGGTGSVGTINFTPGAQTLSNLTINRTGTYTISLGTNLTVTTTFSVASTATGILDLNGKTLTIIGSSTLPTSSGGLLFSGSATSNLSFLGTVTNSLYMNQSSTSTSSLSNLTLNKSTTLTLGNALNIIDSICPTLGTIATGGNLILIADQGTVGHVGRVGLVSGTLSGNITSQVYHNPPPGNTTNWMLMGSAGVTGQDFSQWNSAFHITCTTCPDGNGASNSGTGNPFTSITTYNEPAGTYPGITNITNAMNIGTGYWVFMGSTLPGTPSAAELISVAGPAKTGGGSWPALTHTGAGINSGYNLLANPYPSPISWNKVMVTNPGAAALGLSTIHVYSRTYGGADYLTYNASGGISVPAYAAGTNSINDVIPAGLGFYVVTSAATTLSYAESDKVSGNNHNFLFRNSNPQTVQSSSTPYFSLIVTGGTNGLSEAAVSFSPNSSLGFDAYDALAMPWNYVLQISTASQGNNYTINGMPDLTQNYSIPVRILSGTTTQYTITPTYLQNIVSGACLKLHDNYGIIPDQDLRSGAFSVTINDTETVARFVLNITVLPLSITTNATQASCNNTNDGSITAVGNDAGPWNYTWKNASGTVVQTSLNKATSDVLTGLNNGVYSVDVTTVGTCNSATQTFTITAPAAPTSVFTAPMQVNVGANVSFTNNSIGATNYIWNFGNGDISSQPIPTYAYNMPGTYTITLDAIIASCNDTVSSTQVIQIDATTGIKQANSGSGDIILSRDGTGNYLQFDYPNQTKVNITVYNILGQTLLNNAGLTIVNDRIYLNVNDSKNQVLYVTIANLNNNQQTTKKFVND